MHIQRPTHPRAHMLARVARLTRNPLRAHVCVLLGWLLLMLLANTHTHTLCGVQVGKSATTRTRQQSAEHEGTLVGVVLFLVRFVCLCTDAHSSSHDGFPG